MDIPKHRLVTESITNGAGFIRSRLGLVFLLYLFDLIIAVLLAVPVYSALVKHVGPTGFGVDLIQKFDLVLWWQIIDQMSEALSTVGLLLLIVVPLYLLWKAASHMGVIYALHQGAIWPFWRGVGYHTLSGLALGFIFLPMKLIGVFAALLIAQAWQSLFPGEIGAFWGQGVIFPFISILVWATFDLFQRYARIALVVRHETIWNALTTGFRWPFKYGAASGLYLVWFVIVLIVTVLTQVLNAKLHVGMSAIAIGFIIQQISLFTRSAAKVGWIGSEVSLFERTHLSELPLIAEDTADVKEDLPGASSGGFAMG